MSYNNKILEKIVKKYLRIKSAVGKNSRERKVGFCVINNKDYFFTMSGASVDYYGFNSLLPSEWGLYTDPTYRCTFENIRAFFSNNYRSVKATHLTDGCQTWFEDTQGTVILTTPMTLDAFLSNYGYSEKVKRLFSCVERKLLTKASIHFCDIYVNDKACGLCDILQKRKPKSVAIHSNLRKYTQ